jgi:acyl CoA:acetate/3-ketoacid CoA transferase
MEFAPKVSPTLAEMDARIFLPEKMDYLPDLIAKPRLNLPDRLRENR